MLSRLILFWLLIGASLTQAQVVINEIQYNPYLSDETEFIELYNAGPTSLNLGGWIFRNGGDEEFTLPPYSLPAGQYVVLARNLSAFQAYYDDVDNVIGSYGFDLGNDGDQVRLFDPDDNLVDLVPYLDDRPWPDDADGDDRNRSLELIAPVLDNSQPYAWLAETEDGTPGAPNLTDDDVGEMSVSPLSITYGEVEIGEMASQTVSIANTGDDDLYITSLVTFDPAFTIEVSGLGVLEWGNPSAILEVSGILEIAETEVYDFQVHFSPDRAGEISDNLQIINFSNQDPIFNVPLDGIGGESGGTPEIEVDPLAVDFGTVPVGESRPEPVNISNAGTATLRIDQVTIDNPVFVVEVSAPFEIQPSESVTLTVQFQPDREETFTGEMTIASNDMDESEVIVNLSGTGSVSSGDAQIWVNPLSVDFGRISIGESSTRIVNIASTGSDTLVVQAIEIDNPVFTTEISVPFRLAPGQARPLTLQFQPQTTGQETGTCTIFSNDASSPETDVSLHGEGIGTNIESWSSLNTPRRYELGQNYPNPFNPSTTIRYSLPEETHAKLTIYNLRGQLIKVLVDQPQVADHYAVEWDGTDTNGNVVSSGIYFYQLEGAMFTQQKTMVLLQ